MSNDVCPRCGNTGTVMQWNADHTKAVHVPCGCGH